MKTRITNIIGAALLPLSLMATQTTAATKLNPGFSLGGSIKVAPPSVSQETIPNAPFPFISKKTTVSISLEWRDKSSVEDGYRVYRKEAGGDWVLLDELGPQVGASILYFYTDQDLTEDTPYCYRVEAYNTLGAKVSPEDCAYTNRLTSQSDEQREVFVEDREGLIGELEEKWTGKKTIYVADNAEIDLTGAFKLPLKEDVTLVSGRDRLNPGALLFTRMHDWRKRTALFRVVGDNVRVTGLRIRGPELGIGDGILKTAKGIFIDSKLNIEIDHNELFGWSGVAIYVQDKDGRINGANADAVDIHDNFIHYNQYENSHGYGVETAYGAYAVIERNVFDFNRHAIAADGREGTGYLAYENLVLKNGGVHCRAGICGHTHQFDMHGRSSCLFGIDPFFPDSKALFNCGLAGEYMDIRYNTFQYTAGKAFKLRGTPELWDTPGISAGAFLASNVFAHPIPFRTIEQTETGLYLENDNRFGINTSNELGEGDFDGDGVTDKFQATGVTWWYASGGQTDWRYLNTSDKRLKDLVLRDVDGNGRTDVLTQSGDGWLVSYDGTGPWTKINCLICKSQPSNFPSVLAKPSSGGPSSLSTLKTIGGAKQSSATSSVSILPDNKFTSQIRLGR